MVNLATSSQAFWEFGLLEWRPWHSTPSLRMAALLSALLMVLGLVVVGKQRPTAERNAANWLFSYAKWMEMVILESSGFWKFWIYRDIPNFKAHPNEKIQAFVTVLEFGLTMTHNGHFLVVLLPLDLVKGHMECGKTQEEHKSCRNSRADLLRVLLTLMDAWLIIETIAVSKTQFYQIDVVLRRRR